MKIVRKYPLIFFFLPLFFAAAFAGSADNRNHIFKKFSDAKKAVYRMSEDRKTFYCGCSFDPAHNVDLKSCGYIPRKDPKRASKVEIEHVVPAAKLCGKTPEWKLGAAACVKPNGKKYRGRKCASEHNASCMAAYNDLHNLRPAIGEVNNDRKDYDFGVLPGSPSAYGSCQFATSHSMADPPDAVQGDIGRIYLHMNEAYPELSVLSSEEVEFFTAWSGADPVTIQECRYQQKIEQLQKTRNRFVDAPCREKFPELYR